MRSRSKPKKEERDVRSMSPASKSILKKTKEAQDQEAKVKKSAQTKFNLIQPHEPISVEKFQKIQPPLNAGLTKEEGNATENIDQLGTGTHAVILDQRFQQYLQGQKKLAYELGEQKKAIQNLQFSLQERVAQYDTTDVKIWRLTEAMSEISMHFAIQMIRLERDEEAIEYLNLAKRALEPLPGSEWGDRHEWQVLRRDLYKNLAIFNQNHEEWQKAFDNLRFAISHERILGESTANSSLTCAVLLSKMHRFAECIEYGQQCCNEIEQQLKIDHLKPLAEYKYNGKSKEVMLERDKQFTTYGIANHLLAKALLNLQYYKEARYFLNKASVAINKCLNQPKRELSLAIGNDMARIAQIQRGTTVKIMTAEQVQGSLVTIKTDLATRAMSGIAGDRIEQRLVMRSAAALEGGQDGDQEKILLLGDQTLEKQEQKQEVQPVSKIEEKEKEATRKALQEQKKIVGQSASKQPTSGQNSPQNKKEKKSNKPVDPLDKIGAKEIKQLKESIQNKLKNMLPITKKETRKKSVNVKTPTMNLAKDGADEDPQGVKYSEDRSIKSYLRARKKQIRELNKDLGYSESDQSLPEIDPNAPANQKSTLPPIQPEQKVQQPKSPLAKSGGNPLDQSSVPRRNYSYSKKEFIDARPDQPNSNTLQLIKTIQSGLKIKIKSEKSKSPQLSQKEPSEDYSDEVIDELTYKLQKQMYEKQKKERQAASPGPDTDHRIVDLQTLQSDEAKQPELEESQERSLTPRPVQQAVVQDKKTKVSNAPKVLNQMKGSILGRLQNTKKQSQSTPRQSEQQQNVTSEKKTDGQQLPQIPNKAPQSKSQQKTMAKINMFQQPEQRDSVLSTLKRQGTPPLQEEISAQNAQNERMNRKSQKSIRQPKQQETPQQKETPFASKNKAIKRNSLLYAVKYEKGMNTGNSARGGQSVFAAPTPASANRPTSTESVRENLRKSPFYEDRRVNGDRLRELSMPKKVMPKQLTEEEIEQQNAKMKEYYERKKRYMKFDFAEYVSKDEFVDPEQYQLEIPKQYSQRQVTGIDAIQKQRAVRKKLERDANRQAFLSERKNQLVKSQSVDVNLKANQENQEQIRKQAQDKVLRDVATRDKFYELLSPTSSQEADNPFMKDENNQELISPNRKTKNKALPEKKPFKRRSPGQLSSSKSPGKQTPAKAPGSFDAVIRSEQRTGTLQDEGPGSGQEGTGTENRGKRGIALMKNTTKAIMGMKRGGQAPTQTLMMKKKVSGKPLRNPYDNYDQEQDSEIQAHRAHQEQSSTLHQLRNLEKHSATKIQSLVRKYFTRKWYVNLMVRKRLSVPFSGIEFATCPFLRQFNRVNQKLQAGNINLVEVVNMQAAELKGNLIQVKTPGQKKQIALKNFKGQDHKQSDGEEKKVVKIAVQESPKRRIVKGATPDQLLTELKNDFIDKGLDAYNQFKKLGVGVDFDEYGNAFAEGGIQKVRKIIQLQREAKLAYIGLNRVDDNDERAYVDPQKLQTAETAEYLTKVEARKNTKGAPKDRSGAAQTTSMNMRLHVMNKEAPEQPATLDQDSYQSYSREPIVFFKRLGYSHNNNIKWNIFAGNVFRNNEQKMYLPVKIVGKPLRSRSTVIMYTMNLELMEMRKSQVQDFEFETIWPVILYLFNNWVKHQVTLMGIKRILPGMKDRLPESNYTIFECHNDLKADFEALEDEAYKDMLNFSSELEIDDRFENKQPELLVKDQIDKSRPEGIRKGIRENAQDKRRRLFNEYRKSVARAIDQQEQQIDMMAGRRFVHFAIGPDKNLTLEEQMNILGDNTEQEKKFYMQQKDVDQFKAFLSDNFVRLPKPQSNQNKLMKAMSTSVYSLIEKQGGLSSMHVALMNEERRKIKSLPPISQIDYNCIDRAAIKLRLILDCLQIERRMSGTTLVPRDLKLQHRLKSYHDHVQKQYDFVLKKPNLSVQLMKLIGLHIQFSVTQDRQNAALQIKDNRQNMGLLPPALGKGEQSQEYSIPSQIDRFEIQKQPIKHQQLNKQQYEDELDQEILGNQNTFKSDQIALLRNDFSKREAIPTVDVTDTQEHIFNMDQQPLNYQNQAEVDMMDDDENVGGLEVGNIAVTDLDQMFMQKYLIETILPADTILDQGCLRFNGSTYIGTILFKKIHCNYDNVRILQQIKEKKYQKHSKRFINYKADRRNQKKEVDFSDKTQREERLKSKPCSIMSTHPEIRSHDHEYLNTHEIKGNRLVDLQVEMNGLPWTCFQSYVEISLCTRLSSTMWADSVVVSWENLQKFFRYFGVKNWDPAGLLKRQSFNQAEAFIFYHFFGECLAMDPDDNVTLTFSIDRLNDTRIKFDSVFLHLQRHEWTQRVFGLNFFYPDILLNTGFDQCTFDRLDYPFMQDPNEVAPRIMTIDQDLQSKMEIGVLTNLTKSSKLEMNKDFQEGEKAEILVDEGTIAYLQDPNSLFNLTLSKFPQSQTIFLGGLSLRPVKSEYFQPIMDTGATKSNKALQVTSTPTKFNVRIDYYVTGVKPALQIRAFSQLVDQGGSQGQVLNLTVNTQKIIKDFIRICGQTQQSMVINQLQSILAIGSELSGKRLVLNHSFTRQRSINSMQQDIYTMIVLNEQVLSARVGPHNTQKFNGIINLKNLSKGMSNVLACVNQYDLQSEMLIQHGDIMMQLIYGNKHITQQMITRTRELILQKILEEEPHTKIKEFTPLTMWRITINEMHSSKTYNAIITQEDLLQCYETEVFQFFKDHPNIQRPNLLILIKEYLTNLYKVRTAVGTTLVWNLPQYKPQLDQNGMVKEIMPENLNKLPILNVYQEFLKIMEQQNAFHDQNRLPISLDHAKNKRINGQVPKLCLKTRTCIERVLPIYEAHDLRALKYDSTSYRIITQVTRVFPKIAKFHFAVITVTQHESMECWILNFYFPIHQRTFTCTFFTSDLFALDQKLFLDVQDDEAQLWTSIVNKIDLQMNQIGDIIVRVDTYAEAIKELLYQTYAYNQRSKDIYFVEVTLKSFSNYVTDMKKPFLAIDLRDEASSKDYTVQLRAYSLAREQWIKDYQPLIEIINLMQQDGLLRNYEVVQEGGKVQTKSLDNNREELMLVSLKTTNFYYSMIRNAAVLMANKITFAEQPQPSAEIKKRKLTYDLQQILKAKQQSDQPGIRGDFQNLIQLNRIIYQATVALNPIQICSITYNESKDRFVYRLYRPSDSMSIERRFDGTEIQKTCCPHYIHMLNNAMEKELGQRIAKFYHANILVASVLQIHNLQGLVDAYPNFNPNQSASLVR